MRASDQDVFFGTANISIMNTGPSIIPDPPKPAAPAPVEQVAAPAPELQSGSPHPAGLPAPPSGRLDIPPGAYVYTGPPLPPNTLGRADWLPDDAAPNCMRCGKEFNLMCRRHHCRQCGQLFCHRCCSSKALLQPDSGTEPKARIDAHWLWGETQTEVHKPQKVCGKCFDLLLPMQPFLTATMSKAAQPADFSTPNWREWAGKPISCSFKLEIKKVPTAVGTGCCTMSPEKLR